MLPMAANSQNIAKDDTELFESLSFVQSRLTRLKNKDSTWTPGDIKLLRRDRWEWTEIIDEPGIILSEGKLEEYKVNPTDLSIPVDVKGKAVILECRIEKCISVQVTTYVGLVTQNPERMKRFSEQRHGNQWWFATEDDARRVASALTLALSKLGAKQKY